MCFISVFLTLKLNRFYMYFSFILLAKCFPTRWGSHTNGRGKMNIVQGMKVEANRYTVFTVFDESAKY